jgi:glycolate oxidase iron-sulfur subunit
MGQQLLERKMNNIAQTGAEIIATGNPGCMMQIAMGMRARGLPMEVMHPVELLDEAYRAGGLYSMPVQDVTNVQKQRLLLVVIGIVGLIIGAVLLGRRRKP